MFEGILVNVIILLASLLILDKASHLTITNSVKVADITGFGKTTIGFILVAFSTSLPELSVAIFSAVGGEAVGVAVGNVLGSNIVNVCLILGLCILMVTTKKRGTVSALPLSTKQEFGSLHFGLFVASLIPLTLLYIGYASRFVGVVLLAIFVVYTFQLSRTRTKTQDGTVVAESQKLPRYTFWAFFGAVGVVISSYFIVDTASYIALQVGVPRVIIGATVVAFGTSIPELATSITATKQGHLKLAFGNIIGSGFINITCILGVTLIASQLTVNMAAFSDLVMFSLIANLFLWYFLSSEKIGWREGGILLFFYFLFLVISFGGYRFNSTST
ncbi:MAG: sodium:calcium antiporter [Candidatus Bathyarchaeia archaeon]|nr:sodium:calcium antiporter [Candidatus Bathyarchaeota archaeon A05DMB-4]MDH7594560.1 sodium:calcium antiporter [Candidatus Bathyarchaeota archaeon]